MSDLDDFKATYFDECSELLNELEEQFAAIEDGDRSSDRLNAVFRAIHSIKGGGGAFGFSSLVGFAHAYETLLDHVRDGRIELSDPVAALCIRANDIVADFVAAAKTGEELGAAYGAGEKAQFDALTRGAHRDDEGGEPMEEFDIDFVPVMVKLGGAAEEESGIEFTPAPAIEDSFTVPPLAVERGYWEIRFTPHSELYARANDPLLLFRELGSLGEIEVKTILSDIPPLADFEPFGVYCSWEITLTSPTVSEADIAEVFEFVEGNCDLSIAQLAAKPTPRPAAVPAGTSAAAMAEPEAPAAMDEATEALEDALLSFSELAEALKPKPTAAVTPIRPAAALDGDGDRRGGPEDRRNGVQSIRVDLDKIDRVVNMVGELVITQSM
ncbi:MAG: Hpt domain-containing protein, partial [Devosia sp.]